MNPLRRNVNLIMDEGTYRKLGNQVDIEKAWKLVRCIVGEEIFQKDFVTVPHIKSASFYNQLFVFKKQMFPCSLFTPRYKIYNNLDNLLNIENTMWIPQYDFSPWNPSDVSRMCTDFSLVISSAPTKTLQKTIEVSIQKAHSRSARPPIPGSTILQRCSFRGYALYVITSVVLVAFVRIVVTVGSDEEVYINSQTSPLGFKYRKYKILRNGTLLSEMETTLKFCEKEAIWMKPKRVSILRSLSWDPMGRRHDGRRPIRNILTMTESSPLVPLPFRLNAGQVLQAQGHAVIPALNVDRGANGNHHLRRRIEYLVGGPGGGPRRIIGRVQND